MSQSRQIITNDANTLSNIIALEERYQEDRETVKDDPMIEYLGKLLTNQVISPPTSIGKRISVYSAKSSAIGLGLMSGVPYIAPAMKFAGDYKWAAVILGYGIYTSLGVVYTWAFLDVTNSIESKSHEEKVITKKDYSVIKEVIYWTALPILGLSAAFPVSYLIFKYNDGSYFYPANALFTDVISNTCSLNKFNVDCNKILPRYVGSQESRYLEKSRSRFLDRLNKSISMIPSFTPNDLVVLEAIYTSSKTPLSERSKLFIYTFMSLSQKIEKIEADHYGWFHGFPSWIVSSVSTIFPTAWATFGIINSYTAFEELFEDPTTRWILSVVTTSPYFFLEMRLAMELCNKFYNTIVENAYGTYQPSFAQKYFPKSYLMLLCAGLFTTGSAFGARAEFVTNEIEGTPGIALAIVVCISTVAYKSAAMLDLIQILFEKVSHWLGDVHVHKLTLLTDKVKKFSSLIEDANIDRFANFMEELNKYVEEHTLNEVDNDLISLATGINISDKQESTPSLPTTHSWFSFFHSDANETTNIKTEPEAKWYQRFMPWSQS